MAPTARVLVVGLGPAGEELLTAAALEAIATHPVRFVRTTRHPAATAVGDAESFDGVYEQASSMEEVYATIASRLVEASARHGAVLYAVPGSPVVGERSVELLAATPNVAVEFVAGLSFVDLAWLRLGVDPVAVGARVIDGHRFDVESAGSTGALLVGQCDHRGVLEAIKLVVGALADRPGIEVPPLVVCARLGLPDEEVRAVAWHELDRVTPDHLTSVWIPPLPAALSGSVARLVELMARLRQDCPWDRAQDHASLRPHLLEETHEVLEVLDVLSAADPDDPNGDVLDDAYAALEEELGDLLFQVVFHACLATEAGRFTLADVADGIADKLVARHPHVFAGSGATTAEELRVSWEERKREEKGRSSVLDGIPAGLPALALAAKVLRKATVVPGGVEAMSGVGVDDDGIEVVVGERLVAEVEAASALGVDAESALRAALARRMTALRTVERGEPDVERAP